MISVSVLARLAPVKHTLLLHANKLNADYMDELVALFVEHGYRFVSLSQALEDTAYETPITRFFDGGLTWLEYWARSQGQPEAFFADQPELPEWVGEVK